MLRIGEENEGEKKGGGGGKKRDMYYYFFPIVFFPAPKKGKERKTGEKQRSYSVHSFISFHLPFLTHASIASLPSLAFSSDHLLVASA